MTDAFAPQADIDYFGRLRIEMERPPYHGFLKLHPVSADAQGNVVIRLPYQPFFARAPGEAAFHGGVIAALIDIAGHAAIAVRVGRMVPTIDLRIDYLRPAPGGELTARAKVVQIGRSIGRADIEIVAAEDKLVAVGRGTYSTA